MWHAATKEQYYATILYEGLCEASIRCYDKQKEWRLTHQGLCSTANSQKCACLAWRDAFRIQVSCHYIPKTVSKWRMNNAIVAQIRATWGPSFKQALLLWNNTTVSLDRCDFDES